MKTNLQKIISVVMIGILVTIQIGCAGKVTKISAPLDQVQFGEDYRYSIKFKEGKKVDNISGASISTDKKGLIVKNENEKKTFLYQAIDHIDGIGERFDGMNILKGAGIGVGIGFLSAGAIGGLAFQDSEGFLAVGGLGAIICGLVGAGIGAMTPKYNRVQITPIIEPTSSGVNAGGNLQINF